MTTIWLSAREYNCILPRLFNSTRRRKRDISNFVAPEQMRNTVVRSLEFPNGVFVNTYGEVKPDDPRSGVYKCADPAVQREPISENPRIIISEDQDSAQPTKSRLIKRLRRGIATVDSDLKRQCRQREAYTSLRKYIDQVQELINEWKSVRRSHPCVRMTYDSDSSSQICSFTFAIQGKADVQFCFDAKIRALCCTECGGIQIGSSMTEVCHHTRVKHSDKNETCPFLENKNN